MDATRPMTEWAVKAKTNAFGNYIDPDRTLVDLPNMVIVELDVPEYERNGLGRMLAKTLRYEFQDLNRFGCEAMSIGADSSRAHMVYEDMKPRVLGTFAQVEELSPAIAKVLFERKYGPEMVWQLALTPRAMRTSSGSSPISRVTTVAPRGWSRTRRRCALPTWKRWWARARPSSGHGSSRAEIRARPEAVARCAWRE
jgi:hypothetical protein